MTCDSCTNAIKSAIINKYPLSKVDLSLTTKELLISTNSEILLSNLNDLVRLLGDYEISDKKSQENNYVRFDLEKKDKTAFDNIYNYLKDKKPLLIALFVVVASSICLSINSTNDDLINKFLSYYMGMFFTVFSFLKLLSVRGFASSFSGYDIIS